MSMLKKLDKAVAFVLGRDFEKDGSPRSLHSTVVHIKASAPDSEDYTLEELRKIKEIDRAIQEFAHVMREKMVANVRKKDGWKTIPIEQMWDYAQAEIRELRLAMDYEDAAAAQKECADVGNFMMMLFHKLPSEGTRAERLHKNGGNF